MDDYLQRLERLAGLFERGALTKEEFEAEKARLLRSEAETLRSDAETLHDRSEVSTRTPRLTRRNTLLVAAAGAVALGVMLAAAVWQELPFGAKPKDPGAELSSEDMSSTSIEDLIRFSDPKSCTPAPSLSELLRKIDEAALSDSGSTDRLLRVKGFKSQLEVDASVEGSGEKEARTARLVIRRPWHDLRVTELRSTQWGDATGVQIRFQEPLAKTAAVLRNLGFHIPAIGKLAPIEAGFIGLEWVGDESALTCVHTSQVNPGITAPEPSG